MSIAEPHALRHGGDALRVATNGTADGQTSPPQARVRAEGKFLARGGRRLRVCGVTYGPFAPDPDGLPFPAPARVADDFARMRNAGINSVRTYHLPPEWLLRLPDAHGMTALLDVPWPKHLCFLDSPRACAHARQAVREAAERGRRHPCG